MVDFISFGGVAYALPEVFVPESVEPEYYEEDQIMVAVFLKFEGGLFDEPSVYTCVCSTRSEAEECVKELGWEYQDSFVMTDREFVSRYGGMPE